MFELFFVNKIPLSQRVGYVMDGLFSEWISERCMYVTPIKFPVVKVNGMGKDLIPIQLRTAIFILL